MNRFLKVLMLSVFAVLFCIGNVGAITFTDTTNFLNPISLADDLDDSGWGDVNRLDSLGDYVRWTHHFMEEFDTSTPQVLSGTLTLALRDDRDWSWEFGFGWAEDGTLGLGEVDTDDYSFNVDTSFLEDGLFTVTLASLGGDFYIDSSDLKIVYNSAAPVPEPATMLLFGVGLIGIVGLGRRKS